MSELARAVGISRQALYLHFPDRASLLLALVSYVDEREDLQAGIAAVETTPDAAGQIRAWAQMQSWRNPKIAPFARALDQVRHSDQAVSAAWRDRTDNRMRGAVVIATPRSSPPPRLPPSPARSVQAPRGACLDSYGRLQCHQMLIDGASVELARLRHDPAVSQEQRPVRPRRHPRVMGHHDQGDP